MSLNSIPTDVRVRNGVLSKPKIIGLNPIKISLIMLKKFIPFLKLYIGCRQFFLISIRTNISAYNIYNRF